MASNLSPQTSNYLEPDQPKQPQMTVHLNKNRILLILLLISFFFPYWRVFETLTLQWRHNVMYSHGFLIPLISLYLVWARRNELRRIPYLPKHGAAFVSLGVGIGMVLMGHLAGIQIIQALSLIFSVTGIVILIFGVSSLKLFWLPIVYLLFMIPIWEEMITGHFHLPFQKFSAAKGVALLHLTGIPAYHEGLFIKLPEMVLEVAKACSGVNQLVAVVAISIPFAYLFLTGWPRRIFLILIAIIIAILANSLRVTLIGILSYLNIGGPVHGPYHILQGLFVSFVGYAALIVATWVLSKKPQPGSPQAPKNEIGASRVARDAPINPINRNFHALLSAIIIFLAVGSYIHFHKFSPAPLINSLDLFPRNIGDWMGSPVDSRFSRWFKEVKVDEELSRAYRKNGGERVELYIAYFAYQDSKKKVINFRAEELHQNRSVIKVDITPGKELEINNLFQKDKTNNSLHFFWYDINGRILSNRFTAKLHRLWNGMIRGRTNGAIVILSSDLATGESPNGAEEQMKEFIRDVYPLLQDYLPGHKKTNS